MRRRASVYAFAPVGRQSASAPARLTSLVALDDVAVAVAHEHAADHAAFRLAVIMGRRFMRMITSKPPRAPGDDAVDVVDPEGEMMDAEIVDIERVSAGAGLRSWSIVSAPACRPPSPPSAARPGAGDVATLVERIVDPPGASPARNRHRPSCRARRIESRALSRSVTRARYAKHCGLP